MKKYIVELYDENVRSVDGYDWLQLLISVADKSVMVETAIQLLPYTEPRKESCDKCMNEAEDLTYQLYSQKVDEAYQRGLSDAWTAARKIVLSPAVGGLDSDGLKAIGYEYYVHALEKLSASEAIEKIRQYEQKKEQQIQVGDEVDDGVANLIVLEINEDGTVKGFDDSGSIIHATPRKKTGRHFQEIAEVLRKMNED